MTGSRPPATEISAATILLLAAACGVIVANIYYAQPLVGPIAAALGLAAGAAGLIVTLAQIGYGLGLLFIVPLGDRFENRRLVVICVAASALALALASVATSPSTFLAAMGAVGLASVAVQILVPLAAHLAPDAIRGRVVGLVSSGLMIGIMAGAAGCEFRRLGLLVAGGVRRLGGADGRPGVHPVAHASRAQAAGEAALCGVDRIDGPARRGDADLALARLFSSLSLWRLQPVLDDGAAPARGA